MFSMSVALDNRKPKRGPPRTRSHSQPPASRVFKQPPRRPKPQPVWNDNQHDLAAYRASTEERRQRHVSRTSKNLGPAKVELQEQKIRNELRQKTEKNRPLKSGAVVHEVSVSIEQICRILHDTERVLDEAKELLREHKAGKFLDNREHDTVFARKS